MREAIKASCHDFNLRKVFQTCFKSVPLLTSAVFDERVTSLDVKRFFTLNGRIMECMRIERSLFRVASQRGREGEKEMSYEGFARLFTNRGRSLVLQYPKTAIERKDQRRVERSICQETLKKSIN